jgi:hypothetical protein
MAFNRIAENRIREAIAEGIHQTLVNRQTELAILIERRSRNAHGVT